MLLRNATPSKHSSAFSALAVLLAGAVALLTSAGCGAAAQNEPDPFAGTTYTPGPSYDPIENKPMDDSGLLDILSVPDVEVLVDGKAVGKTPISAYKVTAGSHDVTFLDEVTGNRTLTVIVQPGEAKTVKTDRPPRAVDDPPAGEPKK